MSLTIDDLLLHTRIPWGTFSQLPHKQGFYLIFGPSGELVYVGKGFGDTRIKIHFDKKNINEYFGDACYWFWYPTDDECCAKAHEMVIYDSVIRETGKAPKYNEVRPEGCGDSVLKQQVNQGAQEDWEAFLHSITAKRKGFYSINLHGLAKLSTQNLG